MNYDVSSLSSAEDCDAVISRVNLDKGSMQIKKASLEQDLVEYGVSGDDYEGALALVTAQIAEYETLIPAMAPGQLKSQAEADYLKAKMKVLLLEKRSEQYGVFAQQERQFEIGKLMAGLTEADNYIAILEARKLEFAA